MRNYPPVVNDPYFRPFSQLMNPPVTMVGTGVYKVRESKDSKFPKGAMVIGNVGWIRTGILLGAC